MRAQDETGRMESGLCRGHTGVRPLSGDQGPPYCHRPHLAHLELQSSTRTPELQPQGAAEKLGEGFVGGRLLQAGPQPLGAPWPGAHSSQQERQREPTRTGLRVPPGPRPRSKCPSSCSQRCRCRRAEHTGVGPVSPGTPGSCLQIVSPRRCPRSCWMDVWGICISLSSPAMLLQNQGKAGGPWAQWGRTGGQPLLT